MDESNDFKVLLPCDVFFVAFRGRTLACLTSVACQYNNQIKILFFIVIAPTYLLYIISKYKLFELCV